MRITLCLIAFALQALVADAQDTTLFERKQFTRDSAVLQYRILYPENYQPSKKYPVVLFLHGAGERGNNNRAQLKHGGQFFISNRKKFPAIVVMPQCPFNDFWARITLNLKEDDSLGRLRFPADQPIGKTLSLVSQLMDSLVAGPDVNTKKIYIGGLSMGGMGTFEMLWRKPGFFAAAFPICGGGNPALAKTYADGLPIWVFHGDKDPTVKVGNSRLMVNALREAGAKVKYTEYPGVLHNSWDNAFKEPRLMSWLFRQSR